MSDDIGAFVPGQRFRIAGRTGSPLSGLTFAAKDLFDVAGRPTGGGNPDWALSNPIPDRHAWAVLEDVLENHAQRGRGAIDTLRIESPEKYQRLVLAAAEIVLKFSQDRQLDLGEDGVLRISWLDDDAPDDPIPVVRHYDGE